VPTRFYLPVAGGTNLSPGFTTWGLTTNADRLRAVRSKTGTALTSKASAAVGVTTTRDVLVRQYLSDPLAGAQTISGTVKGVIRALESATTANAQAQLSIRVLSKDGATVRGTLLVLSTSGAASEFLTTLTNRKFPVAWVTPGTTLASVSAQDGDRIAIEFGARFIATTVATTTATLNFGDSAASDNAEDETGTAANNPWIEFSQTLTFQAVPEFVASGTYLAGVAGTTAPFAVPAGATAGLIALDFLYKENSAAVTWDAGFTEFVTVSATDHTMHVAWKRLTGADSGTRGHSWTGSVWREGYELFYSNCLDTGNPWEALNTALNNTAATTSPAVSTTPLTANSRIVWCATDFNGGNPWGIPANFASRQPGSGLRDIVTADRVWDALTATGSLTGTATSGRMTAAAFALKPAAAAAGYDRRQSSMLLAR
jgi:hypothetical protein